ncbi:MAG: hypothetical protein RLZZ117_749 [Cyanobacteriota bacterium]
MPRPSPSPPRPDRESSCQAVRRLDQTRRGWSVIRSRALALLLALACWLSAPVPMARAALLHLEGPVPADLGVGANGLAPCPSPAHCARADWPVEDPRGALAALLPSVLALEGVQVVDTREDYLHATLTSRLFGFVDDLEVFADVPGQQLQARSQSRLGDSDLGVNGRRLERLHRALLDTAATARTAR